MDACTRIWDPGGMGRRIGKDQDDQQTDGTPVPVVTGKLGIWATRNGLSAREIARRVNVSPTVIARMLKGGPCHCLIVAARVVAASRGEVNFEDLLTGAQRQSLARYRGRLVA